MFEDLLNNISSFTPFWIYVTLFFFAFVENVSPPSPSDLVIVLGGSLISTGAITFIPTLLLTTIGSVIGFMLLFYFGSTVDRKVVHSGRYKYIPVESIEKAELWFKMHGYYIIIFNRFLPGTRSVISFFAGMSTLDVKKSAMLASISAVVWNTIVLYLGFQFGNNVTLVDKYLATYSNIAIVITVVVVIIIFIKFYLSRKRNKE